MLFGATSRTRKSIMASIHSFDKLKDLLEKAGVVYDEKYLL